MASSLMVFPKTPVIVFPSERLHVIHAHLTPVFTIVSPEIYALLNKAHYVTAKDIVRLEHEVNVKKDELDIMFSGVKTSRNSTLSFSL